MLMKNTLFACGLLSFAILPAVDTAAQAPLRDPVVTARAELLRKGHAAADLDGLTLTDVYTDRRTGVMHAYMRQAVNGIEVYGTEVALHVKPDGSIVSLHDRIVKGASARAGKGGPALTPEQALERVMLMEGLRPTPLVRKQADERRHRVVFAGEGITTEDPEVRLFLMEREGQLVPVWNVTLYMPDGSHWWNVRLDASTGKELDRNDWVSQCRFDEPMAAHALHALGEEPPAPAAANDLNVFPMPLESPSHGARALRNAPWTAAPNASPFGWNDTDGAAGAEFTITRGNNVYASEDRDNNNAPGFSPDGGPTLDFDFPLNLALEPIDYESAAIANLYYWNNIIHDVMYQYGFDEVSGNFQVNNYGNGGAGNDAVNADAQDGSGTNNANFGTPPDGSAPRMQMFRWTNTVPARDSDLDNGVIVHEYGHGISNRLVGGPSNTSCLANAEQMGEGWSDYYALMFTMEPGDQGTDARGIGTHVLGQPVTGLGIRPAPYSTNFGVNAYTYASTNSGLSQPHGIGFVWCTMLWEMTWDLITQYGFSPDLYNGTAGNNIAMNLVTEGLRYTACNPGFVDGRDAILQADQVLYGGANQQLIWAAFARRGLGFSASQGSSGSRSDQVEAFDVPLNINVGVSGIIEPLQGMYPACANDTRPVKVRVRNNGLLPQSNIPVNYRLDNGAVVSTVLAGPLNSGQVVDLSFPGTATITGLGGHVLKAWTSLPGDLAAANDTTTATYQLYAGTTVAAPFLENFESGALCGTSSNCGATVCALPNGWVNVTNTTYDGSDWRTDENDTPTTGTGPATDYAPGTTAGNYLYLESSSCSNSEALLLSPCIDLSGVVLPRLRYAYHMYGATMGSLRVDIFDGEQWHLDITPVVQGDQGNVWRTNIVNLDAFAGGTVLVRFRGRTGSGATSDLALDAIEIYEGAVPPVVDHSATPAAYCVGGKVTLIDLSINDPTSWNWTLSPSTGFTFTDGTSSASENPVLLFTSPGTYDVTLEATNVYGSGTFTRAGAITIGTSSAARFDLRLDRWGGETTWNIKRLNGTTVASGGPFTNVATNGVFPRPPEFLCLDVDSCYVLEVNDSYGDGMCCDWGQGNYLLTTGAGDTLVFGNGQFTFQRRDTFCLAITPRLSARVLLEGPWDGSTGLMRDQLRSNPAFPLTEPYTALGFTQLLGGGETIDPGLLSVVGNDAIVDWVRIELRDAATPSVLRATLQALVQRDGDVVDVNGSTSIALPVAAGNYHVAIRHRNHLGAMTGDPVVLGSTPTMVDLSSPSQSTFGTDARKAAVGVSLLWAGNVIRDGQLKYAGGSNDRDPILVRIGGSVPTATASGYWSEDVTLDAVVKYAGAANDRDPILVNIGGIVPTAIRVEQLP